MNDYEKRKLLLDAALAIAKEHKYSFYNKTDMSEAVSLAKSLLEQIEESGIDDVNSLPDLDGLLVKKK